MIIKYEILSANHNVISEGLWSVIASFHHHPILIRVYPRKRGWLDLPHSNSNLSNAHSPSRSIQGILLLQTNGIAVFVIFPFDVLNLVIR